MRSASETRGSNTNKLVVASVAAVLVVAAIGVVILAMENSSSEENGSDNTDPSNAADSVLVDIVLGVNTAVDGSNISTDQGSAVYQSSTDGYTVINIVSAGTYNLSGTAVDTQVLVNAGDDGSVVLVLDGVHISCGAAPAILVSSAYDPLEPGEGGVIIRLAEGTTNTVEGSHTEENSGAISSVVSLVIEGEGSLTITADSEGIETLMHLTIDGGNITITSTDDALNANEDGVSCITINGGTIIADASSGSDGDGIDSNGYIIINGGTVYGFSSGQNSGLDSDLGTVINGGLVFAAGRMNDGVSGSSEQDYIYFSLSSTVGANTLVYILDGSGDPVVAFRTIGSYSSFLFSSPELSGGTYSVYTGGAVSGSFDAYGLCISFEVTTAGTLRSG